jgi:hypothetical protein
MIKKIIILSTFFVFSLSLFADSSYDRTIEVLDSSREEKVKQVFRELIGAYQDEDARQFFDFVSEDRFLQDYVTFTDGIYQDFRYYDILEVDYYFDQVVPKGIKRFLYVRWEKRYETLDTAKQYTQTGYSRFLFDEVDGKYLLIELAGNNLWADSVEEWTDEVPVIPGQEVRTSTVSTPSILPDLVILNLTRPQGGAMNVEFDIANIGTVDTPIGVDWVLGSGESGTTGIIPAGGSVHIIRNTLDGYSGFTISVEVDAGHLINESNEANNVSSFTYP